jgi:hypothetical protein
MFTPPTNVVSLTTTPLLSLSLSLSLSLGAKETPEATCNTLATRVQINYDKDTICR